MFLKVLILTLKTEKPVTEPASKLRGYISQQFPEYPLLHHHIKDVGFLYSYPRVQYKVLGGTPVILGLEEGADILKKIVDDINELQLGNHTYLVEELQINQRKEELGPTHPVLQYRFVTPWLALNPDNYKQFHQICDWKEKKLFLNRILIGNILSVCKSFNYLVTRHLHAHSHLDIHTIEYKGIPLLGFMGDFRVNFRIPPFFGLGKGVSQGFGVVRNHPG